MKLLLKKITPPLLGGFILLPYTASAAVVYDSRDYFEALPTPKVEQVAGNLWTYHLGDADGAFLSPSTVYYNNPPGTNFTPSIGPLTTIGS